jgi:hypothetical protein
MANLGRFRSLVLTRWWGQSAAKDVIGTTVGRLRLWGLQFGTSVEVQGRSLMTTPTRQVWPRLGVAILAASPPVATAVPGHIESPSVSLLCGMCLDACFFA